MDALYPCQPQPELQMSSNESLVGKAWASVVWLEDTARTRYPEVYWMLTGAKIAMTAEKVHKYFTEPVTKTFRAFRKSDCYEIVMHGSGGPRHPTWHVKDGAKPFAELTVCSARSSDAVDAYSKFCSSIGLNSNEFLIFTESSHWFR
jgi:hypothetical protein